MKTAMQELIIKLQELKNLHPSNGNINQRTARAKYVFAILEAKKLLEKEKQQIVDAWQHGELRVPEKMKHINNAEKYYSENFKNE